MKAMQDTYSPGDTIPVNDMRNALAGVTLPLKTHPTEFQRQVNGIKLKYDGREGRAKCEDEDIVTAI